MKFPKYAIISNTTMRLLNFEGDRATYYRDAGHWQILVVRVQRGSCQTELRTRHDYAHLNDVRVVPITKKQWFKENGSYL